MVHRARFKQANVTSTYAFLTQPHFQLYKDNSRKLCALTKKTCEAYLTWSGVVCVWWGVGGEDSHVYTGNRLTLQWTKLAWDFTELSTAAQELAGLSLVIKSTLVSTPSPPHHPTSLPPSPTTDPLHHDCGKANFLLTPLCLIFRKFWVVSADHPPQGKKYSTNWYPGPNSSVCVSPYVDLNYKTTTVDDTSGFALEIKLKKWWVLNNLSKARSKI